MRGIVAAVLVVVFGVVPARAQAPSGAAIAGERRDPGGTPVSAPKPPEKYILDAAERKKFGGVFGINFSHYDFDITGKDCDTQGAYNTARCSCSIDWNMIAGNGLRYAYFKATDGADVDLSFARNWSQTHALHMSGRLYRGAYHFLRPDLDADEQAAAFLKAIGATGKTKPAQLPPVLDIEWSYRRVEEGSDDFKACPKYRLRKYPSGLYRCDMWHKVPAAEIVAKAQRWIAIVEKATGKRVIVYTNVLGWWNPYLGKTGAVLAKRQPFWLSAYPPNGPQYDPKWSDMNGSARWSMPPLPVGASYNPERYVMPHFWQFTERGRLPDRVYTCKGRKVFKDMELNWVPGDARQFQTVFGVAPQRPAARKQAAN